MDNNFTPTVYTLVDKNGKNYEAHIYPGAPLYINVLEPIGFTYYEVGLSVCEKNKESKARLLIFYIYENYRNLDIESALLDRTEMNLLDLGYSSLFGVVKEEDFPFFANKGYRGGPREIFKDLG